MAKEGAVAEVDKELEDILENEVKYDSDGVARGSSPGRPPSASPSEGSSGSKGKRRTWKKPKDKPKRPLSAYNIFFKHERSRIVEGKDEEPTAEEVIRSIENILSTSRETRRHRKTHGRISFGDLARKIAEKWKAIGPEHKAVFEHYAELDMRRYRKEVKIWKDKKDAEGLGKGSSHENTMNNSFSSLDSESEFSLDHLTSQSSNDAWAPRKNFYDSMNSSFSSNCSVDSEVSLEPIPIGQMLKNARPNLHSSMPNLGTSNAGEAGIPGFVQGDFQSPSQAAGLGQVDMPFQYGQQSIQNMHFLQRSHGGVQLDGMDGNQNNGTFGFNQLQQQNSMQQQQLLQQQKEMLQRQLLQLQQQQLQQQQQQQQQQLNQMNMQNVFPDNGLSMNPTFMNPNQNNNNFAFQNQAFQQLQQNNNNLAFQNQNDMMLQNQLAAGFPNQGNLAFAGNSNVASLNNGGGGGNDNGNGGGAAMGGGDLENYLSNLDLSNVGD